jgi:hypothetical protein
MRGDHPDHVFEVKIGEDESVAALKDVIKEKKRPYFDDVPADTLMLWKVSIPYDANLEQKVNETEFDDNTALRPLLKLSTSFSVRPVEGNVHIVVDPPALQTSIEAIEPGKGNHVIAAMVVSEYHLFRCICH